MQEQQLIISKQHLLIDQQEQDIQLLKKELKEVKTLLQTLIQKQKTSE
jgi:hypothetical protein